MLAEDDRSNQLQQLTKQVCFVCECKSWGHDTGAPVLSKKRACELVRESIRNSQKKRESVCVWVPAYTHIHTYTYIYMCNMCIYTLID